MAIVIVIIGVVVILAGISYAINKAAPLPDDYEDFFD